MTKFKFGRIAEFYIAKPTGLEIAALLLVLVFIGFALTFWR